MHTPNTQPLYRNRPEYIPQDETNQAAPPGRESIEARAYELWEQEGRPADAADRHWLQAEAELEAADSRKH